MSLSHLRSVLSLHEDWGSSDWYPVLKAMKKAINTGASIEDAAADQADMYYQDMGYDDQEDCQERIIAVYKQRDAAGHIKEDLLTEGYEERVEAAAQHIIKTLDGRDDVTKELVLSTLHKYATNDPHADSVHHNRTVLATGKGTLHANGVPDYNASASSRSEFIKDVMAAIKGKIKYARKAPEGGFKPKKDDAFYNTIYNKATAAIGESWPDGDPIDRIGPWLEKRGYTMKDLDMAFKKAGDKSYFDYLSDLWDSMAGDAMHDAKNGHADPHSPYYEVEGENKIVAKANPWSVSKPAKKIKEQYDFAAWKARK